MRVTLDWDDEIPMVDGRSALDIVRDENEHLPWELRRSSSGDGWHVIIYGRHNDTEMGFAKSMAYRRRLKDDDKRTGLDQDRFDKYSPFLQVLYRRKYMDRTDYPKEDGTGYSTGLEAEVIEENTAVKAAPERERVKDPDTGRLDYNRLLTLVREATGLTQAEVADKTALKTYAKEDGRISRSTVSDYERGQRDVTSKALRRWLRRTARSRGIGHYSETDDGGQAADEVRYVDSEDERRTLVEYVDVPIGFKESAKSKEYQDMDEDDREYGLLNIHTGTYNGEHTDEQLHAIHNGRGPGAGVEKSVEDRGVADQALAVLSPTNQNGDEMDLNDRNNKFQGQSGWTREYDSVNYEREILDEGEQDVYLDNLPNTSERGYDDKPSEPGNLPIFEIILWNEDMTGMEWHCIGLWAGSDPSDAIILRDKGLGNWQYAL